MRKRMKSIGTITLFLAFSPIAASAQCWDGLGAGGDRIDVTVCDGLANNCVEFCVNPLTWDAAWMQDSLARIVFAVGNYGVANDPSVPSLSGISQSAVDEVFSNGPIPNQGRTSFRGPVVLEADFCRTCGPKP